MEKTTTVAIGTYAPFVQQTYEYMLNTGAFGAMKVTEALVKRLLRGKG